MSRKKFEIKTNVGRSFASLLIKNYLIFTLAIFAAIVGIYFAASSIMDRMIPSVQVDQLIEKLSNTEDEELPDLRLKFFLDTGSHFVILNKNGQAIYSDQQSYKKNFSKEELNFLIDYNTQHYLTVSEISLGNKEKQYLLEEEIISDSPIRQISGYLLLDENYNIISGTLFPERTFLSKKEFDYLADTSSQNFRIRKYAYQGPNGEDRTAVLYIKDATNEEYLRAMKMWDKCWLLFIPAYLFIVMVCIHFLMKKTKGFLLPLNRAIVDFFHNGASALQNYRGPTEFMEIADNFNSLAKQLDESEKERLRLDKGRQKLLADISHDLKTPITVIRGYAEALMDGMVEPEDQQKYLETIYKKSERMTELLDMFHEYSKIDHPDLPIHLERKDLCNVLQLYFAEKYPELEVAGFNIEADIPGDPIYCMLDVRLCKRALDNLVNNALKYNPKGTTLYLKVLLKEQTVKILLGDDGSGIPCEVASQLFEPFVTGDESRGKSHGSGLGLAITKKIILAHKGVIRLSPTPQPPMKTQFEIALPYIAEKTAE
ncbi:sensor histidine kinase [Acidaminobacterium chupaoyuni]